MRLELGFFVHQPSRSELNQFQRHGFSTAVVICCWKSLSPPGPPTSDVTIFIPGSYS